MRLIYQPSKQSYCDNCIVKLFIANLVNDISLCLLCCFIIAIYAYPKMIYNLHWLKACFSIFINIKPAAAEVFKLFEIVGKQRTWVYYKPVTFFFFFKDIMDMASGIIIKSLRQ